MIGCLQIRGVEIILIWLLWFVYAACYGKAFGPKGFGYGQGAGALVHTSWRQNPRSFMFHVLLENLSVVERLNIKKPFAQMWLDFFFIKAIKTEPCPYVYIWSGVTVTSEGGRRGTGDDYVLCLFFFSLKEFREMRVETQKDLLEELVRTSRLKVILDELTWPLTLKGNVGKTMVPGTDMNLNLAAEDGDNAAWARWGNDVGWRHNCPPYTDANMRPGTVGRRRHYITSLYSLKLLPDHVPAFRKKKKTTENRLLP